MGKAYLVTLGGRKISKVVNTGTDAFRKLEARVTVSNGRKHSPVLVIKE